MTGLKTFWAAYRADESGATAVEYGLIAGAMSIVIVVAVGTVGVSIRDFFFEKIADAISN